MNEVLEFSLDTVRRAGLLLRDYFGRELHVRSKSTAFDLVTVADTASEQLIVDAIRARFPGQAILAEEGLGDLAAADGHHGPLWLVDPLDGTVNYAHGYPMWGVTLALAEAGQVVLGVIYEPLRDEMYWAERGRGAWQDGRQLRVSTTAALQQSLLATGFPVSRAISDDNNLREFSAVMPRVQGARRAGAATLDLAHVAAGHLDGYWEKLLKPWDWAAGSLLVQEAGGRVTTLDGRAWSPAENSLVATNGHLHAELLAVMSAT